MKTILSFTRSHYLQRVGIFLVMLALIAGMGACGGGGDEYTLHVDSTAGGGVTVNNVSITPGEVMFFYEPGRVVHLNATPDSGYRFVKWTGNVSTVANVDDRTTTITMLGNYIITANFAQITPMVAAGNQHTVGLKSDGTVVAMGDNAYGQCNVSNWTDITQIAARLGATAGLRSNGTVVTTYYLWNVSNWMDIDMVAVGGGHIVGLKTGGTVVAEGLNTWGQCEVDDWSNRTQVAAGAGHTLAVAVWNTVISVGDNTYGQRNVSSWYPIIQVAAGDWHTVGLKSDGTVVAVGGEQDYGQCNVTGWDLN